MYEGSKVGRRGNHLVPRSEKQRQSPTWQEPARQNPRARKEKHLRQPYQGLDTDQESENPDEDTPPPLEGDDIEQPNDEQEQQDD